GSSISESVPLYPSLLPSSVSCFPRRTNFVGTGRGVRRTNWKIRGHTYKSSIWSSTAAPTGQLNSSCNRAACASRNACRRAVFTNCDLGVSPDCGSVDRRDASDKGVRPTPTPAIDDNDGVMTHATPSIEPAASPWRLSVAPMMDWTDRHCRYFHRLLS